MPDSQAPVLATEALIEAGLRVGGFYASTVQGLNSSLALFVTETKMALLGLNITSWISNGTDIIT